MTMGVTLTMQLLSKLNQPPGIDFEPQFDTLPKKKLWFIFVTKTSVREIVIFTDLLEILFVGKFETIERELSSYCETTLSTSLLSSIWMVWLVLT